METSEIRLECLKLISGEPDVTVHIAKADMLYQYCVKDKLPVRVGMSASELTSIILNAIKDGCKDGDNPTDCSY
jgi:hypothetical protein